MKTKSAKILFIILLFISLQGVSCSKQTPVTTPENSQAPNHINSSLEIPAEKKTTVNTLAPYQVAQRNCTLRSAQRENAEILVQLDIGIPVNLIEEYPNGWCKVELVKPLFKETNVSGYIQKEFLQIAKIHDDPDLDSSSIYYKGFNREKLEKEELKKVAQFANRDGENLNLMLENGKMMTLTNVANNSTENRLYHLLDFNQEAKFFIIDVAYYGIEIIFLVNQKNGNNIYIKDVPVFSPDSKRFVVSFPLIPWCDPSQFAVYNIEQEQPILEFELDEKTTWSASNAKWIDNNTISFTRNYPFQSFSDSVYFKDSIALNDNKWAIIAN